MISLYFGKPGCGKTTLMVALILRDLRKGKRVYCNVPLDIPGVIYVKNEWVGIYDISDGVLYMDEAACWVNSRNHKNFSLALTQYINYHRHYNVDIHLFSQRYNAVDLNIRSLVTSLYRVRRAWFGRTIANRISYRLVIPDSGDRAGDIVEGYQLQNLFERLLDFILGYRIVIRRRKYYKYFDSWVRPPLPPLPDVCQVGYVDNLTIKGA